MSLAIERATLGLDSLGDAVSSGGLLAPPSQAGGAAKMRTRAWMDDFTHWARRELDAVASEHRNREFVATEVASTGHGYVPYSEYLPTAHRPLRDGADAGLLIVGAEATGVATGFISLAALQGVLPPDLLQHVTSATPWVAGAAAVVYGGKKAWESVAVFRARSAARAAQRNGVTSRSAAALGFPAPTVGPVSGVPEPGTLPAAGYRRYALPVLTDAMGAKLPLTVHQRLALEVAGRSERTGARGEVGPPSSPETKRARLARRRG